MSEEQEPPRPGNFDRAWNDPPLFSYATSSGANKPSANKLNKRIGFPSGQPQCNTTAQAGMPPVSVLPKLHDAGAQSDITSQSLPPPPPPPSSMGFLAKETFTEQGGEVKKTENKNDECLLKVGEVAAKLKNALDTCIHLDERKKNDIAKRIDTMVTKWNDGSLNEPVMKGMSKIAAFLETDQVEKAEKIQIALIVDWPAQCGTWLVGIKHLISEIKLK